MNVDIAQCRRDNYFGATASTKQAGRLSDVTCLVLQGR